MSAPNAVASRSSNCCLINYTDQQPLSCSLQWPYRQVSTAVASLGCVTPGATIEGVTPLFFSSKTWRPFFFLVTSSAVSPLISSSQKLTTFFAHRFIAFYCFHSGVTHLEGVTPHLLYLTDLVSPLFFVNLPTKIFFLRVWHPKEKRKVSPGASAPPASPHSDATVPQ